MITDTTLLFVIHYIETMTNPKNSLENHEQLVYQLAYSQSSSEQDLEENDNLSKLVDSALESYLNLAPTDLEGLPLHVHLWFVEQIGSQRREQISRIKPILNFDQLIGLYDAIDIPLVRHAIIGILSKFGDNIRWFNSILSLSQSRLEQEGFAMILLDLRLFDLLRFWVIEHQRINIKEFLSDRRAYISGSGATELLKELDRDQ